MAPNLNEMRVWVNANQAARRARRARAALAGWEPDILGLSPCGGPFCQMMSRLDSQSHEWDLGSGGTSFGWRTSVCGQIILTIAAGGQPFSPLGEVELLLSRSRVR